MSDVVTWILEAGKLFVAAGVGAAAKHKYDRARRRRRQADLRATLVAHSEALTQTLSQYRDVIGTSLSAALGSSYLRDARKGAEETIALYEVEGFLALVADDTWARTELLKWRRRLEAFVEHLDSYEEFSDLGCDLVAPNWLDVFERSGRWRRPPRGAKFTTKLSGRLERVRWWDLRQRFALRRLRNTDLEVRR